MTTDNAKTDTTSSTAVADGSALTFAERAGMDSATGDTVTIEKISPLSALKVGAGFGACLFVVWMLAVTIVWIILGAAGVWGRLEELLVDLLGLESLSPAIYFGTAVVIGLLEMIVFVLLAPLAAVVYNSGEQLFGGLKLSLKTASK